MGIGAEPSASKDPVVDNHDLLNLDYAYTDHDSSVYGPAAYFYDLMRIMLSCVKVGEADQFDKYGKYTLVSRRPDLLDIPLDDEDTTDVLVPTLSMVNYILARQLTRPLLLTQTGKPRTYRELMRFYDDAAFKNIAYPIKTPVNVFNLPFNLDYERQQRYLKAMGKPLYDISSDVDALTGNQAQLAINYLGISPEIVKQLASPKGITVADDSDDKTFCKQTHLSYQRLGELLHLNQSKSLARQYIMDRKHYYINIDNPDFILKLTLDQAGKQEILNNLTPKAIIRIGIFNYLSQQLNWDCDELELVLAVLQISDPNITVDNLVQLSAIKQLQDTFKLSIAVIANLLVKVGQPLTQAVMENIRPITGQNDVWQLHWRLLPDYLEVFNATPTTLVTSVLDGKRFTDCKDLPNFNDVSKNLRDPNGPQYFSYYANQTLSYLARLTGVNVLELSLVTSANIFDSSQTSDQIINFVYTLGQLKKIYNRNLLELCQMVCYMISDSAVTDHDSLIAAGLKRLYKLFLGDGSVNAIAQQLFSLNTLNQTMKDQQWDLNDLIFTRFGSAALLLDSKQAKQVASIQNDGLTKPFFRDLQKKQSNLIADQLQDPHFAAVLASNVAPLFGLDPGVFSRIVSSCFQDAGFAFYQALIFSDFSGSSASSAVIVLLQQIATLINLFKFTNSAAYESRRQRMDAVMNHVVLMDTQLRDFYSTLDAPKDAPKPELEPFNQANNTALNLRVECSQSVREFENSHKKRKSKF